MTVGIDFWIVNTEKSVKFPETLHHYLAKKKEGMVTFDLLIELDPYGNRWFHTEDIIRLINISNMLVDEFISTWGDAEGTWKAFGDTYKMDKEVRDFANDLRELCTEALEQKNSIKALGD
ncbi:hypothetical protein [Bacillus alkalicellulosilyticus]|uniref:hypothetical protein n=1 Tax=Alkalihalobacterium alkalicellulosilyticum TaxID=1912214 RepID=UPI000997F3CD|nr:hypothetical protein [Bacillus alkalicellulosilyticus]